MKDNSASGHDMAVASWAVQVEGITDTEIAELVAARRQASGAKENAADRLPATHVAT
jgi:hypothetical protein